MNLTSPYQRIEMINEIFRFEQPFLLESGEKLSGFDLAFTIYGDAQNSDRPVLWVNHALTGNSNVTEWWSGLVGEDKFYDPNEWLIISSNLLGSCYGSSNPLSIDPKTKEPFYYDFPTLTTRDQAKALELLRDHIGIEIIHTLIGGSLGGQVALEWSYILGTKLKNSIIVAANAKATPWIIGFNEAQRMAISADCTWGEHHPEAGKAGLKTARAIGMLTYRHPLAFIETQKDQEEKLDNFKVSSYLRYQGEKLSLRFNALSYWVLTKAMDSHDLGRGRGGLQKALGEISAKVLAIGIDTDELFRKEESQLISNFVKKGVYSEIKSQYGHDAFLIEYPQLKYILKSFYLTNNEL